MRKTLVVVTILPMILAACSDDDSSANQNNNAIEYTCGDGTLEPGEQCDDGSANSDTQPNACRTDCRDAYCNDGVLDNGEVCDDGADNSDTQPDACRTDCTLASCGDGTQDATEICDDGNAQSGDGCSADCLSDESCGNGIADTAASEQCDCGLDSASLPQGCDTPNDDLASHCTTTCQNLCGWSHYFTDDTYIAKTYAVAVAPSGNVAITGYFKGTTNLGGAELGGGNPLTRSKAFVAMYDAEGTHLWSIWLRDETSIDATSEGHGVAFDSQGDVYTMGRFGNELTLNGSQVPSHSGVGTYVLRLDGATGSVVDHTQLGSSISTGNRKGWGLTIDHNDNLLIAGQFTGVWGCPSGPCADSGSIDPFVVKLDSSLEVVWERLLYDTGADAAVAVAVDSDGDVFLSGNFQDTLDLGVTFTLTHGLTGQNIGFVLKLSGANGDTLWSKMLGTAGALGQHSGTGVTCLSTGAVVMSGLFYGTLTLSPTNGEYTDSEIRAFMVAYAGDGSYLWHHTAGNDRAWSVSVTHDDNDNVAFAGYFEDTVDLGGGPHLSQAVENTFLVRYNAQGDYLGSRIFGFTTVTNGVAVAAGPSGTVVLAGYSNGNLGFGCGEYIYSNPFLRFKPFVALLNPF